MALQTLAYWKFSFCFFVGSVLQVLKATCEVLQSLRLEIGYVCNSKKTQDKSLIICLFYECCTKGRSISNNVNKRSPSHRQNLRAAVVAKSFVSFLWSWFNYLVFLRSRLIRKLSRKRLLSIVRSSRVLLYNNRPRVVRVCVTEPNPSFSTNVSLEPFPIRSLC